MRLLPRSAANRIALLSAAGFSLSVVVIGLAVLGSVEGAFRRQLDDSIQQATSSLMVEFAEDGYPGLVEDIAAREKGPSRGVGFAVYSPAGMRIAGSLYSKMPAPGWSRIDLRPPGQEAAAARALTSLMPDGSRLVVAADIEPVEEMVATILTLFGAGLAGLALTSIGFALVLRRYLKHRLDAIAAGSIAFAQGDLSGRVFVGARGDEFDQLAGSLNAMLDRIEALLTNLRQVTSDLAHDLRTPLTRLRGQLERLIEARDSERSAIAEAAIDKTDDILAIFAAILRIAELETAELRRHFRPLDLGELVQDIYDAHEPLASDSGHILLIDPPAHAITVVADRDLLAQALINLIENALRHTPVGSTIRIGARMAGSRPELFVADNGPGIPEDERSRATDRFVRLDGARSSSGHGLGLSLVKAIATAHSGRLELRDADPGLEVTVQFGERQT